MNAAKETVIHNHGRKLKDQLNPSKQALIHPIEPWLKPEKSRYERRKVREVLKHISTDDISD